MWFTTIDHDHITQAIRGLLCGACNSALGFMRDDAGLIYQLAAYAARAAEARARTEGATRPTRTNQRVISESGSGVING